MVSIPSSFLKRPLMLCLAVLLSACATQSPDQLRADVARLTEGRLAGAEPSADTQQTVEQLLRQQPLDAQAAVRIALLNNPSLQMSFAALSISEADRAQAARLPNPHFAFGRLTEGQKLELERMLTFNVLDLLTLPWRARYAGQQAELARLRAAQEVLQLAADTRKAWINAVAARQTAQYLQTAQEAAEAGAELGRRMARVGNWSRLQQAREQLTLADVTAQLARAQQTALAEREKLIRLMGLWGAQIQFTLPDRLPDIPGAPRELNDVQAQALRGRLDVRAAQDESRYVADNLGLQRVTGVIDALDFSVKRNTTFNRESGTRESARGWEVELPLPIFDWGQARNARSEATYMQSVARVHEVAIRARSEAREAYHGYRTAWDLARHYRDEVVPLRKLIGDETLLRYNGMLASVWELLGETRNHVAAINAAIAAQRDFWIADTDLHTALTAASPGALPPMRGADTASAVDSQGH
jgi:outer membrane protein TolC